MTAFPLQFFRPARRPQWAAAVLAAAVAACAAAETPSPEAPEPPPDEAFGVPLYDEALRELHEATRADLDRIAQGRVGQLRRDIATFRAEAGEAMAAAQRTGNVRELMGARAGVTLLDRAVAELDEDGDFEIPEDVRVEIRDLVDRWRAAKTAADARAAELRAQALERRRSAFAAHVEAEADDPPSDEAVAEVFAAWAAADWRAPAAEAPEPEAPGVPGRPGPGPDRSVDDPLIAETAAADAWTPRARVTIEMASRDILRIPLAQLRRESRGTQRHPLGAGTSHWRVEPLAPWPEDESAALRLERIPDSERHPVAVVEWPSERNRRTLLVRDAGTHTFPSEHGFIVLTAGTAPAPDEAPPPAGRVRVDPRSGWTASGVRVQAGDRVLIRASGSWAIGSRGESVGPEGYPDTPAFIHYYAGDGPPRQLDRANYGALLVRVGREPTARMAAVGRELRVQAGSAGELMFDVNERPEREHREDNRGEIEVTIVPLPASR